MGFVIHDVVCLIVLCGFVYSYKPRDTLYDMLRYDDMIYELLYIIQ